MRIHELVLDYGQGMLRPRMPLGRRRPVSPNSQEPGPLSEVEKYDLLREDSTSDRRADQQMRRVLSAFCRRRLSSDLQSEEVETRHRTFSKLAEQAGF